MNALLYAMGGDAEDIMASFFFADEGDSKKYDVVKGKFDSHFITKKNVIYERAKFNQRAQGQDESVENFITALHSLAEFCEYGSLKEEMICDCLVVGLRDGKLSEKLQMDASLKLKRAVQQVRQSESVKKQQGVIRSGQIPAMLKMLKLKKINQGSLEHQLNRNRPAKQVEEHVKRSLEDKPPAAKDAGTSQSTRETSAQLEMPSVTNVQSMVTLQNGAALQMPQITSMKLKQKIVIALIQKFSLEKSLLRNRNHG